MGDTSVPNDTHMMSRFAFSLCVLASLVAGKDSVVSCGSVIKLQHSRSNRKLHSHEVQYGSGSGQQSVTGFEGPADSNSFWIVKGGHGGTCKRGQPIKSGDVIRLEHLRTGRNLHSHLFQSPISAKQEVSAFGEGGNGDQGDSWKVDCSGTWIRGKPVRLQHVETSKWLTTDARHVFPRPIQGQLEVSCGTAKDDWFADEGVYIGLPQEESE
eukprot:c21475_g1_i1.p1 GENE.c21475_g1_i1~~c21475_g1_i1.p1  ORF type:complete len:212 (-),score=27.85 c21475_g1_i1:87-722(-)